MNHPPYWSQTTPNAAMSATGTVDRSKRASAERLNAAPVRDRDRHGPGCARLKLVTRTSAARVRGACLPATRVTSGHVRHGRAMPRVQLAPAEARFPRRHERDAVFGAERGRK